jgi:recombinational DNA repair protein RecT
VAGDRSVAGAKVRKHRDRYNKVGDKHYSYENWEMYGRKVVLLQVLKYMPCSPELVAAMALNDAAEIGAQKIDLKDAIEGSWERNSSCSRGAR